MRVEVDFRKADVRNDPFYGIRIHPDTNEEMADLERAADLGFAPVALKRLVVGRNIHYLVEFERREGNDANRD